MRQGAAFQFIPELIGDFVHTMELSENPKRLYIEAAINTLHTASDVWAAIEEHKNTKSKIATKQTIEKSYGELEKARTENYVKEATRKIDIAYERIKIAINNGQFQSKEVCDFIKSLAAELHKVIDIFSDVQKNPDYPERDKVEEITRRTLRDYNKLLTIFIEEEEKDGKC